MSRSKNKFLPFFNNYLNTNIKKPYYEKNEKKNPFLSRTSIILKNFIGKNFLINNGKKFFPILISLEMVGCKFGEFSPGRKIGQIHNKKLKGSSSKSSIKQKK